MASKKSLSAEQRYEHLWSVHQLRAHVTLIEALNGGQGTVSSQSVEERTKKALTWLQDRGFILKKERAEFEKLFKQYLTLISNLP